MINFLNGVAAAGFLAVGLFFLRLWRETRDRFFSLFGLAFWMMALNGIALLWAAINVYAARRFFPDRLRKPIPYGFAYGAWIYFFMNWVVLPLDAMHTRPHFAPLDTWLTGLAVHVFGIGLAIALSAAKTAPRA